MNIKKECLEQSKTPLQPGGIWSCCVLKVDFTIYVLIGCHA